jgi:hypothetical protein
MRAKDLIGVLDIDLVFGEMKLESTLGVFENI